MKNDLSLPREMRKFLNQNELEHQNKYLPVIDEDSRAQFLATQEIASKFFKARWEHHVDKTMQRF